MSTRTRFEKEAKRNSEMAYSNLPGLRFFVCRICIRMLHSHLNDMEIPETKCFIPKGFE